LRDRARVFRPRALRSGEEKMMTSTRRRYQFGTTVFLCISLLHTCTRRVLTDRRYHKTRMSARQDLEDSRERSSRARREHGDARNENMEKPDKYLASPGCSLRAPDEAPALQTDHSGRQIAHILHQNNPYFTLSPWSGVNPNKLLALNQNSQGGLS
jgi:hypothetical protein